MRISSWAGVCGGGEARDPCVAATVGPNPLSLMQIANVRSVGSQICIFPFKIKGELSVQT